MLIQYFTDFYQKLNEIINDYELDYNSQKYSKFNTADPCWFDEQIQFYNDMKDYCEKNGHNDITKLMIPLQPYYSKSRVANFFKQHSGPDKAIYLRNMKSIIEMVIDYLQLYNEKV